MTDRSDMTEGDSTGDRVHSHHDRDHDHAHHEHGHTRDDHSHGHHSHEHHVHEHSGRRSGFAHLISHALTPHSHDAADSVDDELATSAEGIRAVAISLVILGVTAAIQLAIALGSSSVALLADTIHNFSDALTAVPLWAAFALGRRGATSRFTYGLGRTEDLAGLMVLAAIAASAVFAGIEAVHRLVEPREVTHLGWVAAAGVIGFVGNEVVAGYRIRVGRRIGSAALVADGLHARTDGMTSLAVVAGAVLVAVGLPLADPIIGLLIAITILVVLVSAARDVLTRLLDGVDPAVVDRAREVLDLDADVRGVRSLRMRWIGHHLHAEADLDVEPTLSLQRAHAVAHRAERRLREVTPRLAEATVHAYPAHTPAPAHDHPQVGAGGVDV